MSKPLALEAINLSKRFGDVVALDDVSLRLAKGSFHALLGENGAGKSTLIKCIMGYYQPDSGAVLYRGREQGIRSPEEAKALGIGMVYQHFTLIPNMTVLENLVLARPRLPFRIDWKKELAATREKVSRLPFQVPLERNCSSLSAGEKQKVEIIKQLLLDTEVLFLDEPTSVLTPTEADEVLGKIHQMTRERELTVLIVTHKFREVMQFADEATVLRKGRGAGTARVCDTNPTELAEMMVGSAVGTTVPSRSSAGAMSTALQLDGLTVLDDVGSEALSQVVLGVRSGEIVGVAGVSGNGQRELVEALAGQRAIEHGTILIGGQEFLRTRKQMHDMKFYCLPEEPLLNAGVGTMSIAENLALRAFDRPPCTRFGLLLDRGAMDTNAHSRIEEYGIRAYGPAQRLEELSGGNVQRVILARELDGETRILIVSNPCFGLDFLAAAEIRRRIVEARNQGAAVLLLSEDLDEILQLSDRAVVISGGRFVHEFLPAEADLNVIGQRMAGH